MKFRNKETRWRKQNRQLWWEKLCINCTSSNHESGSPLLSTTWSQFPKPVPLSPPYLHLTWSICTCLLMADHFTHFILAHPADEDSSLSSLCFACRGEYPLCRLPLLITHSPHPPPINHLGEADDLGINPFHNESRWFPMNHTLSFCLKHTPLESTS